MVSRRTLIATVGLIVILALIATSTFFLLGRREEVRGGLLVVLLTPGFEDEVRGLLAEDDNIHVIGAGADPHELQLSPSDVEILRKANVIISMGHTAIDRRVDELYKRGEIKATIINIIEIPGLIIPELPEDHEHHEHKHGHGTKNYHEPFYHPRNLVLILARIVDVLASLRPEKRDSYVHRYEELKMKLAEVTRGYEGILMERKAVISTAEIQPVVEWLGAHVIAYVVIHQHESPSPKALEGTIKIIREEEVIVFIAVICDGVCKPASQVDQRLLEEAKARGVKVIEIPLGYTGTSIIKKLEYIKFQILQVKQS